MNDADLAYRLERIEFMASAMTKSYLEVAEAYYAPGTEREAYKEGFADAGKEFVFILKTNFPEAIKIINETRAV